MEREQAPQSHEDEKDAKRPGAAAAAPGRGTLVEASAAKPKAAKSGDAKGGAESEENEAEHDESAKPQVAGGAKPRWAQLKSMTRKPGARGAEQEQEQEGDASESEESKDGAKDAGASSSSKTKGSKGAKGAPAPSESKDDVKDAATPKTPVKEAGVSNGDAPAQEARQAGNGDEAKDAGNGEEQEAGRGEDGKDGKDGKDGGAKPDANHEPATSDPALAKKNAIEVQTEKAVNGVSARTMVGVGEKVRFRDEKDGHWETTGGNGGADGNELSWTAPSRPGSVKISHGDKHVEMKVVGPSGIDFKKRHALPVPSAGAGMRLNLTILPLNVSFANVEWAEAPSAAENVTGYFEEYRNKPQKGGTKEDLFHNPNSEWLPMGAANNSVDDVARTQNKPGPYKEGSYHWSVPNKYRVKGEGDGQVFTTVSQDFRMDKDGTVTVSKGGQSSAQKADGIIADDGKVEKFESVQEVLDWVNNNPGLYKGGAGKLSFLMRWLQNARAQKADPASIGHVLNALGRLDLYVYVAVCCTNSYSYIGDDEVNVSLEGNGSGFSSTQKVPQSEKKKDFVDMRVPLGQAFNLGSWNPGVKLGLTLKVKDHVLSTVRDFPYDGDNDWQDLGGEGRYAIKMFVSEGKK